MIPGIGLTKEKGFWFSRKETERINLKLRRLEMSTNSENQCWEYADMQDDYIVELEKEINESGFWRKHKLTFGIIIGWVFAHGSIWAVGQVYK